MSLESPESASDPAIDADAPESAEHAHGTRQRFSIYMTISFCSMQACVYIFHQLLGRFTDLSDEMSANVGAWIAIALVSLMNFFWLMHFVYRTADGHRWWQFWKYLQSIVGFRLWEAVVFYLMCKLLGGHDLSDLDLLIATAIMQAQSIVLKFFVYQKLIFKPKPSVEHDEELGVHASPLDFSDE